MKFRVLFCLFILACGRVQNPQSLQFSEPSQLLSLFPESTETFFILNGTPARRQNLTTPPRRPRQFGTAQSLTLLVAQLPGGGEVMGDLLERGFKFGCEGSQRFTPPNGLGPSHYEGCLLLVFESSSTRHLDSWVDRVKSISRHTTAGQQLPVFKFQEKIEVDDWSVYVARPAPTVIAFASNLDYFFEVYQRILNFERKGGFVLRKELQQIDLKAPFVAIRQFTKTSLDLASPRNPQAPFHDPDALSLVFSIDDTQKNKIQIKYFSDSQEGATGFAQLLDAAREEGRNGDWLFKSGTLNRVEVETIHMVHLVSTVQEKVLDEEIVGLLFPLFGKFMYV